MTALNVYGNKISQGHQTMTRQLTHEESEAIRDYAQAHGRRWKSALRKDWMNAALQGPLHCLRNSHGPAWLVKYRP